MDKKIILLILLFASLSRLIRLDYPNAYVFDEVYHAFTAKEYLKGNVEAWEWWTTPPPNVAYEWTHPPLAKELMTASMYIFNSTDSWAWRLPGTILGIISIYLLYLIALILFKDIKVALLSAFVFSVEGLVFVQSRTGMNDIYLITFSLACLLSYFKKQYLLSALFLGLAIASKWTAIYLVGMLGVLILWDRQFKIIPYYIIFPPLVYLASYIPFLQTHSKEQFIELHKQMWWYHTNLKATHDYASPWWSWPLNLYPVWYYVEYLEDKMANIFAGGNPIVFWTGITAIVITLWDAFKTRSKALIIILLGYLIFWLPWAISPRIMFLYHYSPSIPFLSLALGYQLSKYTNKKELPYLYILLGLIILGFAIMYPFLTGIPLPKDWIDYFFMINLAKNPFG